MWWTVRSSIPAESRDCLMSLEPLRETKPIRTAKWTLDKLAELALVQLVLSKWSAIVGIITAILVVIAGWVKGLTYTGGVLLGIAVLLACSLATLVFALARNALRNKTVTHNGKDLVAATDAVNHEKCERDNHNLESRALRWEQHCQTVEIQLGSCRTQIEQLEEKLKSFEWLENIAKKQKQNISDYAHAECWIVNHSLTEEPLFIDFRCRLDSAAVYDLSVTGIRGTIRFGNDRLTGSPEIVDPEIRDLDIGGIVGFTITQKLERRDAVRILNHSYPLNVDGLSVELKSARIDEPIRIVPQGEISTKEIKESYPRLIFKFKKAVYAFIVNHQDWSAPLGYFVMLEVEIENPRNQRIEIDSIVLSTLTNQRRIVTAPKTGEIYEGYSVTQDGQFRNRGPRLKNLAETPMVIVGRGKVSGYLEFVLDEFVSDDAVLEELKSASASLTLTDKYGETHTGNHDLKARQEA